VIAQDTGLQHFKIRLVIERGRMIEFHGPADITAEITDAIVNAANSSLLGGGGVDGAIHRAGGPAILAECRRIVSKIGSVAAGKAVITTAGNLPAKYVIHTVGPVYRGGGHGESEQLASCYRECIRLADDRGLKSLSFPAISTGAFGYPVSEAAIIAISSTLESLASANHINHVRFVLFDVVTLNAFASVVERPETLGLNPSHRIERPS
jgi:O-acetyl-ADP-ribose deacetylase (regulator of RNase III)